MLKLRTPITIPILLSLLSTFAHIPRLLKLTGNMSLPGLELTQPSEERSQAPAQPSQISLTPGSEWRFEVAFGHIIKVKVRHIL